MSWTNRSVKVLVLVSLLCFLGGLSITTLYGLKSSAMTKAFNEGYLYRYMKDIHIDCKSSTRVGKVGDGGWNVCLDGPYFPRKGCKVYSFGINYDFSFDDGMASIFGCRVLSFDPSMKNKSHQRSANVAFIAEGLWGINSKTWTGWVLKTLKTFLHENGDGEALIDFLKFDIESSEWEAIPNMVNTGVLNNVKQIGFEIHTSGHSAIEVYDLLELLVQKGFRKWHFHFNPTCSFTIEKLGLKSSKCVELYFINTHFLVSKLTLEGIQNTPITIKVK